MCVEKKDEGTDFSVEEIRRMDRMVFDELAGPYYLQAKLHCIDFNVLRNMLQKRIQNFSEIPQYVRFLHHMPEDYPIALYRDIGVLPGLCVDYLEDIAESFVECAWEPEKINLHIEFRLQKWRDVHKEINRGQLRHILQISICGSAEMVGTIGEIAYLLGRTETIRRIRVGIAKIS